MDKVPAFAYRPLFMEHSRLKEAFDRVLHSGQFVKGKEVQILENMMEHIWGMNCVACSSGSDALILALSTLEIGPGDEVITTPYTHRSSTASILHVGATPVWVDTVRNQYYPDPEEVEAAITDRTAAFINAPFGGHIGPHEWYNEICTRLGIDYIVDAAQAYDPLSFLPRPDVITHSFFPAKIIGALGDAGMVMFHHRRVDRRTGAKAIREHGKGMTDLLGWNMRMDEFQAAYLRVKVPMWEDLADERRAIATRYHFNLGTGADPVPPIEVVNRFAHGKPWPFYTYQMERPLDKVRLIDMGKDFGIEIKNFYPILVPFQPGFLGRGRIARKNKQVASLGNAFGVGSITVALPVFPGMTEVEQNRVIRLVRTVKEAS